MPAHNLARFGQGLIGPRDIVLRLEDCRHKEIAARQRIHDPPHGAGLDVLLCEKLGRCQVIPLSMDVCQAGVRLCRRWGLATDGYLQRFLEARFRFVQVSHRSR